MTSSEHGAAYQQPAAVVIAGLGGDDQRGLATEEAQRRLAQYGPNELQAEAPAPAWRKFLAQFQNPLPYEALVIFATVLLNPILGFIQEERAERSVAALRAMAADEASVLGDGQLQPLPAAAWCRATSSRARRVIRLPPAAGRRARTPRRGE